MKKGSIVFLLLCCMVSAFAATRTISNSGGNYNDTLAWVERVVPTSADDVVATDSSGHLTVNVSSAAKTFILTGYNDTLRLNANLTIAGNITLDSGMAYLGTAILICSSTSTLRSNGVTVSGSLQFNGTAQTYTLADNWNLTGALRVGATTSVVLNGTGFTVTSAGGLIISTNCYMLGAASAGIILTGGTWSQLSGDYVIRNNITLAGNVTITGSVGVGTGQVWGTGNTPTLSYSSGTITTTGSTLMLVSYTNGTVIHTNGMSWNNVITRGQMGHTFTSNMDVRSNFTYSYTGLSGSAQWLYGNKITVGKDLIGNADLITSGTTLIEMNGKGRWYCNSTASYLQLDLTINTTDTITIVGNINYGANWNGNARTATLTYTAGTVVTTGSTLTIGTSCCNDYANCLLNCSGITWNNVTMGKTTYVLGGYVTLAADLNIGGNLTFGQSGAAPPVVVNGAYNINLWGNLNNVATSSAPSGTATLVLKGKNTWTNTSTGGIQLNTVINSTDTVTISGSVIFGGSRTLTYTAGVIKASTGTLVLGACTANFNATTPTFSAISVSGATIFGGTYGWNATTFYSNTPGSTTTFAAGNTYTITGGIVVTGTSASRCSLVSSSPGTQANLTLNNGITEDVAFCNVSHINNTGQTLWSYKGAMTNAIGCRPLPMESRSVSYIF